MTGGTPLSFGAASPPSDPRALALRILSEARFRISVSRPPERTWWDHARQWLADRWQTLVDAFSRNVHIGKHAGVAVGDVLIVLAIGAILIAGVRLLRQLGREYARRSSEGASIAAAESARRIYARSVETARSGAYAQAIILLFRSTLAALDMRRLVADAPSRTVNETRREIRRTLPAFAAPFEIIARAFTAVAYADAPAGEDEWARAHQAYAASFGRDFDGDA